MVKLFEREYGSPIWQVGEERVFTPPYCVLAKRVVHQDAWTTTAGTTPVSVVDVVVHHVPHHHIHRSSLGAVVPGSSHRL